MRAVCGWDHKLDERQVDALATTAVRRPLPALIALVALLALTALVWWRVLQRGGSNSDGATTTPCPTHTAQATLPAPAKVTVKVLNATKRNGIASRARTVLVTDGFNIPGVAANDKPKVHVRGVAEIRYGPAGEKGATLLHYYLPGAKLVPMSIHGSVVTLSLGNKYKGVASQSSVTLALQQDRISTASPNGAGAGSNC